ncbi:hypothetical protein [Leifsonia sp. Leaf264]|uniref:hypothetical protein n=1 Tax=Leifsonia sp. Leaf264 TaxID=1736314 RepID=UPI0012FBF337|nr:hypothetical protein [Leifsonia sp. Leaf264]
MNRRFFEEQTSWIDVEATADPTPNEITVVATVDDLEPAQAARFAREHISHVLQPMRMVITVHDWVLDEHRGLILEEKTWAEAPAHAEVLEALLDGDVITVYGAGQAITGPIVIHPDGARTLGTRNLTDLINSGWRIELAGSDEQHG